MPVSFSPWLVALSIALAIQGSYVGLSFAVQVAGAEGARQRALLAGAAITLGLGVWTMHFVGMLAERVPFPVDYLVLPTLLSFLVCVIVVGAAVLAVSAGHATLPRIAAAAVFMGLGIVAMHYVGMETLRACAEMVNSTPLALAAAAIAIAASGLALWLAFSGASQWLPVSATVLGLAISGMHYTAVAGLSFIRVPRLQSRRRCRRTFWRSSSPSSRFWFPAAFCCRWRRARVDGRSRLRLKRAAMPERPTAPNPPSPEPARSRRSARGGPPRRPANAIPVERNRSDILHSDQVDHGGPRRRALHPGVRRNDVPLLLLSIGVIESRLDPRLFVRVHRSHIVRSPASTASGSTATAA